MGSPQSVSTFSDIVMDLVVTMAFLENVERVAYLFLNTNALTQRCMDLQ